RARLPAAGKRPRARRNRAGRLPLARTDRRPCSRNRTRSARSQAGYAPLAENVASKLMDTAFHLACTISASGSIGVREVLQSSPAHLSRGPNRLSPSERRQSLGLRPLASGRSAIVVARRRDLRAAVLVRAAASEPLRHARSSHGRDRRDGRALRAQEPRGGQLRLLSRATFLRWRACSLQTSTVVWRLAVQVKTRDPKAKFGNLRLGSQRVCSRRCVFSGPSNEHRPSGTVAISVRGISDSQICDCLG